MQISNTRTKYHKILTINTKAPHNPTLRIVNRFIKFKYRLGHCKTNYDWFCTTVYMTVASSQCVFHYTWRALQTSFREGCKFVDDVSIMPNPLRWHHDGRDSVSKTTSLTVVDSTVYSDHRLYTSQVSGVFGLHRCVAGYLRNQTILINEQTLF